MHISTEQLLAHIDRSDPNVELHLQNCKICSNTLTELLQLQTEIRQIPDFAPPADLWSEISKDYQHQSAPTAPKKNLAMAVYALAASILIVGLTALYTQQNNQPAGQENQRLIELMAQSKALEYLLLTQQDRSMPVSANINLQAERLRWQLSLIDQQLNVLEEGPDAAQIESLWQSRVNALQALHDLHRSGTSI